MYRWSFVKRRTLVNWIYHHVALNVLTAFQSSIHKVGKFDITCCIVKFKNDGIEQHLLLFSDTRLHQGVDISKLNKQKLGIKIWLSGLTEDESSV